MPAYFVASAAIGARFGLVRLDKAMRREIDWALDHVDARALARRSIGELSGGERQRLLLSQALTLYTTPVIYIFFDNLAQRFTKKPNKPATGDRELAGPA